MKRIVVRICATFTKDLEKRQYYKRHAMTRIPRPGDLITLENGVNVRVAVSSFDFATGTAEALVDAVNSNAGTSWREIHKRMSDSGYAFEHDKQNGLSEAIRADTWISRIAKLIDIDAIISSSGQKNIIAE